MARTTEEPRKRPKNRKAQIALVAAELFCERGYHGVGVDEIAAAVGISGPAVYRHFPNKYAVLVHATRELGEAVGAAADTALDAGTPRERLDALLAALARIGVERRKVGGLYQWENSYLTPADRETLRAGLSALVRRVAGVLRELRPELDGFAARLLVRAMFSTLSSPSTHRATLARPRAERLLRSAAWAVLTADPTIAPPDDPAPQPEPVPVGSRRELLLTEAMRLFHLHGYHSVGIEDIGRAAGINASSVYRYFPSKADLLAAAYYRAAERVAADTTAALGAADGLDDALRRLVDGYVALTLRQRDLVSVYLTENNNLPDRDRHELRKLQRLQVDEWVRLLTGIRPELSTADARILVHAALNIVADLGTVAPAGSGFDRPVAELALAVLRSA